MSQTIFLDPVVVSVTNDPGNTGNGVLSVTMLGHYTIDQTYTATCIQTSPSTLFSLVGDVDGSVGLATAGTTFTDQDLKFSILITEGATPFAIGDVITFEVQEGSVLNEANINTYDELPQKNYSAQNDDNVRFDGTETYSFNKDEVSDAGNFFEGNAVGQARDFITRGESVYPHPVEASLAETDDETLARKILKLTPQATPDTTVSVAGATATRADGTQFGILNKDNNLIQFTGGSIDFATGTGTNLTAFTPANLPANNFVKYTVGLDTATPASLIVAVGTPDAVEANTIAPKLPTSATQIGVITVQDDGTGGVGNINDVEASDIIQFSFANSGSTSDEFIQEIINLRYAAGIDDRLDDAEAFEPTETTASFDSGSYSIAYDNQTITVAGNNVTIPLAANFTVQVGDAIKQGTAYSLITAVNSQSDFDVADGSVLTTATSATISQVAKTINLTNFGDASTKTRSSDFIQTNIEEALVWYEDGVYQDTANSADVAYSLSSNNTDYTVALTRPNDFTDNHEADTIPNPSNSLYIIFMSNEQTGSGTVRLESYRIYYHTRTVIGELTGFERVTVTNTSVSGATANNNTGSLIPRYRVVRADVGGGGDIQLADNASFSTGRGIGVTIEDISNASSGTVAFSGIIDNANTVLGFSEGDELFLGTNGQLTNVAPTTAGQYVLKVGEIFDNGLVVQLERRGTV